MTRAHIISVLGSIAQSVIYTKDSSNHGWRIEPNITGVNCKITHTWIGPVAVNLQKIGVNEQQLLLMHIQLFVFTCYIAQI